MIITISAYWLILVGAIVIYLLVKANSKKQKDIVYVDTSGIHSNPPNYLETLNNKTINIKLDKKHNVSVCHFSVHDGLMKIRFISSLFKTLDILMNKGDESLKNKATMMLVHNRIIKEIYKLSSPFAKFGYKRAFYKKAMNDILWTLQIAEQIYDYWCYLGKSLALLAEGQTQRQTIGGVDLLNASSWDRDGKILIKPRFAST